MCLRAERGVRIADKTTLKMMREMGISCGSPRDRLPQVQLVQGQGRKTFENVIGRDFAASRPWEKMGTDVTEFKQPSGKAYFAPVYDFGSKEIVAWSTSLHPNMAQQHELLDQLVSKMPEGSRPVLHSDIGWRYQQAGWCKRLEEAGVVQGHLPEGQLRRQRRDGAGVRPYEGRVLSRKKMALLRRLQEGPGRIHHPLEHEKEAG